MINGQHIICIGNSNWFGNYAKSTVQLLERLARTNKVLFVEYPYTIKDIINSLRGKQSFPVARMLGTRKRLQEITTDSNTSVHTLVVPPVLPLYFLKNELIFNLLFKINAFVYKQAVRKAIRKLGLTDSILITAYNPFYGLAMDGKLGEKVHIYYCYDGVEAGFFGKRIFRIEDDFSRKVKAIITTSDHLKAGKSALNANTSVVKNGVDFPSFFRFAKVDIYKRERKKAGFIGSLDPRFDIDTMEYVISHLQQFDFEFTGDMRNHVMRSRLSKFPNVQFFQPVKPTEVPGLLAKYDVGIIPYIVNEVNRNIYPLKINEYLAVGVPVVMNPFAHLPEFDGMASIAADKDDFCRKLLEETETDSADKIKKRIAFASTNSWDNRTEAFSNIIEKLL